MKRIDTDIADLELRANRGAFFISGWDKSEDIMNAPSNLAEEAAHKQTGYNRYFFMSTIPEAKKRFCQDVFGVNDNNKINSNCISIAPNGTAGTFLSILAIKDVYGISNVLLISPTYYADINVVQTLGMSLFFLQANPFCSNLIDFNKLEENILQNNIQLIIIIDPPLGTGIAIDMLTYSNIWNLARKYDIWVLIDYVYGGMEWERPVAIVNEKLLQMIIESPKAILIESISKRLFFNGAKNAVIYTNPRLVKVIEEMSESFIGSFSCVQYELFNQIYDRKNRQVVLMQIEKNIEYVKSTFELIKSTTLGYDILLSHANCGYFALIGVPIKRLGGLTDKQAAFCIADKTNILTIPHTRYLFDLKDYYCFRINLAMDRLSLVKSINLLLDTYFD